MRPSLAVVLITRDAAHLVRANPSSGLLRGLDPRRRFRLDRRDARRRGETRSAGGPRRPNGRATDIRRASRSLSRRGTGSWCSMRTRSSIEALASEIRRVTATPGRGFRLLDAPGEFLRRRSGPLRPLASVSYVDRLFQKGKGRISDHRVHERVLIEGPVETARRRAPVISRRSRSPTGSARTTSTPRSPPRIGFARAEATSLVELLLVAPALHRPRPRSQGRNPRGQDGCRARDTRSVLLVQQAREALGACQRRAVAMGDSCP